MTIDKKILAKLQRFCSYRERCKKEVQEKLRALKVVSTDFNLYIEALEEQNFLNEKRFAFAYANDKFKLNKWGKIKIAMQLKSFQIDGDLIRMALDNIDEEEYRAVVKNLIDRYQPKLKGIKPHEKKQQLLKYLYGKGFEPAIAGNLMK
jgi:regulatory protein